MSEESKDKFTVQPITVNLNGYPATTETGEDEKAHTKKTSSILNIWDFLGDSDAESNGASSTRSPLDGDGNSTGGFPSDYDTSHQDYDISNQVPSDLFEEPCQPVSTSGGTASFFHVRYRAGREPPGYAPNHYVGKDLSHAGDEIDFYDSLRGALDKDLRYANFAEMCMDCPGVSKLICKSPKDSTLQKRFLLLLENLWNGYEKMRLVDVKMGAETSVACWKGKSRFHAWKNARVDQVTNSVVEGFRLEGMECPPKAIQDRIEAVEVGSGNRMRSKIISGKAAKRFLLQRLRACEFMASWCDVTHLGKGAELHAHSAVWSAIEQVGKLLRVAIDLPVPQQWIGSSIAMGLEVGKICKQPTVRVKVFDWGRAELSSIERHETLTMEQRKDRLKFWRQYIRAVCRFYWELCRIAAHRCCCTAWKAFVFELRVEPLSIVRAAIMGKTVSELRGVGLYQMPSTGIKGGSNSIVLPLVAPKGVSTPSNNKSMIGALHVQISASEDVSCGEGSIMIEIRGATQLVIADLDAGAVAITVVRLIGFENSADARLHCEKYRGGHPEPTPRGRSYAMSTAPGKIVAGTMVWENSFEFVGLGDDAAIARARMAKALPELLYDGGPEASLVSPASSSPFKDALDYAPWPDLLPPTIGDQSEAEAVSQVFSHHLVSWLDEDAPLPKGWP